MAIDAAKVAKSPFVALRPVPVALVSCGHGQRANVLSIAWMGVLCSEPPQVGIGVRPSRHSHGLIRETGEFVVNLAQEDLLDQVEYCGFVSGREGDKFAASGLTRGPGSALETPIVVECPINIECRVRHQLPLGSHDLFVGQVVSVQVSPEALDERGWLDNSKLKPILYTGDQYWGVGELLGRYGFKKAG